MKFKKWQFFWLGTFLIFVLTILGGILSEVKFPMDTIYTEHNFNLVTNESGDVCYGSIHTVFQIFYWSILLIGTIVFYVNILDSDYNLFDNYIIDDNDDEPTTSLSNVSFKKFIKWCIILFILGFIYNIVKTNSNNMINLYNNSKLYQNSYTQKVQEKEGFYDKLWKTYLQKDKITNINKETFLTVTKMIMENRKDGQNLTWKWVQENQQIPYEQFTMFYTDLSNFITSQREGYFNIEKDCQLIANKNNTMLDTFPNNMYNKILDCEHIQFEYGFLSDSTVNVFKTKKENLTK